LRRDRLHAVLDLWRFCGVAETISALPPEPRESLRRNSSDPPRIASVTLASVPRDRWVSIGRKKVHADSQFSAAGGSLILVTHDPRQAQRPRHAAFPNGGGPSGGGMNPISLTPFDIAIAARRQEALQAFRSATTRLSYGQLGPPIRSVAGQPRHCSTIDSIRGACCANSKIAPLRADLPFRFRHQTI
jgi:hypothetical protein